MPQFDVVIVGGGAAGLAAAIELADQGRRVCLLEARDRLGGRIHTVHLPSCPAPIELGAELIHGRSAATARWLQRVNIGYADVSSEHWTKQHAQLTRESRLFEVMKRGLKTAKPPQPDVSFAEFLETAARNKLSPPARKFARALVEGFDAGDAERVSTLQTLKSWSSGAAADAPTFRPIGGYGALIKGMSELLDHAGVSLHLNTTVTRVQWSDGVVIEAIDRGRCSEFSAKQAVIALPLGVLQEAIDDRAIHFTPTLDAKRGALAKLESGPVLKVLLRFREPFWEKLEGGRYCNASFVHAPELEFPTFWTALPIRAPLMVAWAGGPNAARLSVRSHEDIVGAAVASLRSAFSGKVRPAAYLEDAHLHNWQSDPFARGAYSYVLVGGSRARASLSKPLADTLYFAGEATDATGEAATVAGALLSGERVAREILAR